MRSRRETSQASAFTKFRLLMWKNFLQQWRHPVQTVVELLLPVITLSMVLILRSQIEPMSRDIRNYQPIPAKSLDYSFSIISGMNLSTLSIAYSPESPILDDIIRTAMVNLLLPESPMDIDIVNASIRIQAYNSSAALRGIYYDEYVTREVIAAVEFDDTLYGALDLPMHMSYALRFPEKPRLNSFFRTGGSTWRTDQIFPNYETPGPRFSYSVEGGNDPGYVNEMFIALQHTISMELVSRLTGQDLSNFLVNIQRYPHPSYIEDFAVEALLFIFPMFIMLSYTYNAVNIIRSVTVEKELQLKEAMKIMGLPTWLHWTAWFCKQFIYLLIGTIFVVIMLKVNWFTNSDGYSDYAVFTNTHWTVLLFYLMLYLSCMIFFCFMISGFFSKASTAALFGGIIWFVSFAPALILDVDVSMVAQVFLCFSINTAMSYGFELILSKESTQGMQWGQFMDSYSPEAGRLLFGHVVIMLAVNCFLYMGIALYLEQILPGPYGAPKKWYFPFQRSFWFPNSVKNYVDITNGNIQNLDIVKEDDPTNLAIGVKISNLTKVYGSNIAVKNLNLNIYDDQITVLLGHNGAGKSTTISMITGNVEVTSGNVLVAGYNITTQTSQARSHLGLCPQHNVLFNELTVREHLEFFARLKGYSGDELNREIDDLINSMEMQEKRNYQAAGLSGGQKRRLCVGVALCGGARVVLLDEPTSGMDPASRRALWELLQRVKHGRSIILTTHFMDEADFLGDRVAIMSSGELQCVGSPFFLKSNYGVGYTLVIVKKYGFNIDLCTELIGKYIPGTIPKNDRGIEATYRLPNEYSHVFEDMLTELENNSERINFKNYGLVATTLEDVFMSVGSDVEVRSESEESTIGLEDNNNFDATSLEELDRRSETVTGWELLWFRVSAIWLKLLLVWSRSWGMLALQILVPILFINLNLGIMQFLIANQATATSRSLTLAEGYSTTETFLSYNGTEALAQGALAKEGYGRLFETANLDSMRLTIVDGQNIDDYYLERTREPAVMGVLRNKLLIGATFSESSAVAWFSNFGYHDVATSLAAVHSALLKGFNPLASLKVSNHPLETNYNDDRDLNMLVSMVSIQVAASIGNALAIVSAVFIMFYIKERVLRAKLLQKAAGVQPIVMWGATAIFDWAWFCILCVSFIISCAAFGVIGLSSTSELGRLYLCFMVYGAAMLPLHYLFSLLFNGPAVGFIVMFFANSLLGLMGSQVIEALSMIELYSPNVPIVLDYILQFFPLYGLVTSARSLNTIGLTKHTCLEHCDQLGASFPNFNNCTLEWLCENFSNTCCIPDNPYFSWESPGIARYITCMIITGIVCWLLLMLIEYAWLQRLFRRERPGPPIDHGLLDEDVVDEIRHARRLNTTSSDHCLVAKGLTKYYGKHLAVNQISFSVGEGECFGLLGVNGAGKTTTFKMLMGDESISSGDAFVSGYSVKKNITKVHQNIGYCPQFDAIFGELTGRETLYLFSRFRGLRDPCSPFRAELLAETLGFSKHIDKRVDQYSGGNRRKLSTAVALLGRTRLVFVDEPTTGVDPAAKRTVWRAMRAARRAGRALVLTSHSMEECEALCSRLTIMVNGRFQCLGSPQHLKNKFSEGFTLTIKMKQNDGTTNAISAQSRTDSVKNYVNTNYNNPKLMEEYQGLMTFYLPDRSIPWSKMFSIMERAKRNLGVEDYSIQQTSLEQVFLQFTKYQQESR